MIPLQKADRSKVDLKKYDRIVSSTLIEVGTELLLSDQTASNCLAFWTLEREFTNACLADKPVCWMIFV
jgi:hypothetical protein